MFDGTIRIHKGVSENGVYPIVPNGFADQTIPFLKMASYHWEYTNPTFSVTNPNKPFSHPASPHLVLVDEDAILGQRKEFLLVLDAVALGRERFAVVTVVVETQMLQDDACNEATGPIWIVSASLDEKNICFQHLAIFRYDIIYIIYIYIIYTLIIYFYIIIYNYIYIYHVPPICSTNRPEDFHAPSILQPGPLCQALCAFAIRVIAVLLEGM